MASKVTVGTWPRVFTGGASGDGFSFRTWTREEKVAVVEAATASDSEMVLRRLSRISLDSISILSEAILCFLASRFSWISRCFHLHSRYSPIGECTLYSGGLRTE